MLAGNTIATEMRDQGLTSLDNITSDSNKITTAMKLESINMELEKLFKKELDENKEKEALMVSQSRYAAMGEMINNIAHQWRQPLNILTLILNNIEDILTENSYLKNELKQLVLKSYKLINSMSETIDDFKDFFKPKQNKEIFNLKEKILSSYSLCSERIKQNGIEFRVSCSESIAVYGYSNQMSQVLLNLFSNSIDALIQSLNNDKKIVVSVECIDRIIIEVLDTGIGISEGSQEKVFDPYFTTKDKNGTGIGLYMTKLIIEKNFSGTIELINTQRGTCFRITIPEKEVSR